MAHPLLLAMLGYDTVPTVYSLRQWLKHVHPLDRERVEAGLSEFVEQGASAYEQCHRMIHRDGTIRWFVSRAIVVERTDTFPTRVVGADIDVTGLPSGRTSSSA